jgi:hypothetical protein
VKRDTKEGRSRERLLTANEIDDENDDDEDDFWALPPWRFQGGLRDAPISSNARSPQANAF